MILLTTRKSRFFVVLVHLVGVTTHLPSSYFSGGNGIAGVNPHSIILETLEPATLVHDVESRILLQKQPHWLQDVNDQSCLDPTGGFSDCGDATSWMVVPKYSSRRQARWRQWITWATEEEETEENTSSSRIEGYALQLVDDRHFHQQRRFYHEHQERIRAVDAGVLPIPINLTETECLTRRRKDNQLILAPCSQDRAWGWQFTEDGVLHFKKPRSSSSRNSGDGQSHSSTGTSKQKRLTRRTGRPTLHCLGRNNSQAVIIHCDGHRPASHVHRHEKQDGVIQISIVRQVMTGSMGQPVTSAPLEMMKESTKATETLLTFDTLNHQQGLPPSRVDIAHSHATVHSEPLELKTAPRLTSLSHRSSPGTLNRLPASFLEGANPIFAADTRWPTKTERERDIVSPESVSIDRPSSPASLGSIKPTIRKIQINPYVANSQDEQYTDSQTGLVFRTDLCEYLGHERKDAGRHTLVGVGYYTKTVFNIKVYGVALYVSKRDVLADPAMEEYATLTTEELRERHDFYKVLRLMTGFTSEKAGTFDRTIFLKTNMQLATETMRSSLDADWKFLTQEAKDLLIGSSMKPRPASQTMLDIISSPDNPSRCSCAQIAPEEYNADPECCARGTELVFTWRKNGDLEARLNGDFMDTFERPDIAEAIFFEYLRVDDPMSTDFIEHAIDGFPMMLGPLSQVKGVSAPSMTTPISPSGGNQNRPFVRALGGVGGALSSGANNVAGFVQSSATDFGAGAVHAAKSVGEAAKNLGEEMDRRRELIGKHVSHFAQQTMSSIYSGKDAKAVSVIPRWLEDIPFDLPLNEETSPEKRSLSGRTLKKTILSGLLGATEIPLVAAPDEISPMIHPTARSTQRHFLWMVHLYLLLMLIVSFPTHLGTKSRVIVSRKGKVAGAQLVSDSDSDAGSSTGSEENTIGREDQSRRLGRTYRSKQPVSFTRIEREWERERQ